MRRVVASAIAVGFLLAAPAGAHAEHHAAQALRIADSYHPGHVCEGQVDITWTDGRGLDRVDSATGRLVRPSGKAIGLANRRIGGQVRWWTQNCDVLVRRGMSREWTCKTIVHEVAHLALRQAAHTGSLAYGQPVPPECRGRRYAERKHRWYHERSKHPDRVALAVKWHRLARGPRA